MSVIVFGASGFLGRNLRRYFLSRHKAVVGTYFTNAAQGLIKFDLRKPNLNVFGDGLRNMRFAVIASAISEMDRCKRNWDETYEINVAGTIRLITELRHAAITPVFVSTDYVYDGIKGNYGADDHRAPLLAYGAQKKEVEDFLLAGRDPCIIVRPGRLYSLYDDDHTIVTDMANQLRANATLHLAADQVFSLSSVLDVCRAVDALIEGNHLGCYNTCADPPISRFALGTLIKNALEIDSGRIVACSLADLTFGDRRPLDTSLDNRRFTDATGIHFEALETSLNKLRRIAL